MAELLSRLLAFDERYDGVMQSEVASFAAQMDDQYDRLKRIVANLSPADLERQAAPRTNTIGMLLAHMAIAEIYWMNVAAQGLPLAKTDDVCMELIGMKSDDDGMPMPDHGNPPTTLTGKDVAFFLKLIDTARARTHQVLLTWKDSKLNERFTRVYDDYSVEYTFRWVVYHVVEHFCWHTGQVGMIKGMIRGKATD